MNAIGALGVTLRSYSAQREFSGSVLMTRGDAILFEGSYGLADRAAGTPVSPRTRFGLASVTKMFTATAIADLVTQERLSFHVPVLDLLPRERRPSTLRADVTIHHLLTHTSGIADYAEEDETAPRYLEDAL